MDVSYYFGDLFLNYDNERWQFAPIAGRNLVKTVLISLFLCIEKLEKFVGLNLRRKLTT